MRHGLIDTMLKLPDIDISNRIQTIVFTFDQHIKQSEFLNNKQDSTQDFLKSLRSFHLTIKGLPPPCFDKGYKLTREYLIYELQEIKEEVRIHEMAQQREKE